MKKNLWNIILVLTCCLLAGGVAAQPYPKTESKTVTVTTTGTGTWNAPVGAWKITKLEAWGGGGRDMGIQVQGDFMPVGADNHNLFHYQVMVSNGPGINVSDNDGKLYRYIDGETEDVAAQQPERTESMRQHAFGMLQWSFNKINERLMIKERGESEE